jgi:hypothetical protein
MPGHDESSVMSKFANELIASMKQAAAHARGRKVRGMRVTTVEMPALLCVGVSHSTSDVEESKSG